MHHSRLSARLLAAITIGCFSAAVQSASARTQQPAFERTEQREPCASYDSLKRPLFGDLHVHTSYSFDSYISSQRNDPFAAYWYAKGRPITLPDADGAQNVRAQIQRPLDFASITDHSEYLGQINVCTTDASKLGYWWPHCLMTRSSNLWTQLLAASWWTSLGGMGGEVDSKSFACNLSDCEEAGAATWALIQQAAEEHYDRSSRCSFTTFVGYEYTDAPNAFNMHRNVIFRNENVTETPFSTFDTGTYNFPKLWKLLREACIDADAGCDVLAIPHNPNLAGGLMFRDPESPDEATDRLFFEPLVELTQHKGSSECRFDRLAGRGVGTEDEQCDFEQVVADNLTMLGSVHGEVRTEAAAPVPIDEFARRNMVRNALKDGLALGQETGTNPFRMGFIGSTDSHSATPGGAEEDNYVGHLGRRDADYRNVQDHFFSNPGGHAVVWAEENSRDAIFEGLRRKETYATSGTRPVVRFFGGPALEEGLCESPQRVERAYRQGVPMGGQISGNATTRAPRFLVSALKDAGTAAHPGTDLQQAQIIKGWVDADGEAHERVSVVAGNASSGATVEPDTCAPKGAGFADLCAVWEDPDFDPAQPAFYYVRVLENPTCRWSTLQCQAAGVNPFAADCREQAAAQTTRAHERGAQGDVWGKCCLAEAEEPFYSPVIQERAWTSPIWYQPATDATPDARSTQMPDVVALDGEEPT
ncbi:MAG: DUF3604 domain-containing protein [Deltaproteobacteria bacterium]|nr:DUF3604 domain-containing protein [Deltaproteobacteria bacterium]MBW2359257.1 DUF3604 domain-containing protein [Deltaproteobacteria bacterium]